MSRCKKKNNCAGVDSTEWKGPGVGISQDEEVIFVRPGALMFMCINPNFDRLMAAERKR